MLRKNEDKFTIKINQKQTHLTMEDRGYVQEALGKGLNFKEIGYYLHKDPSTISKEVKLHRSRKKAVTFNKKSNNCLLKMTCERKKICGKVSCNKRCCFCDLCNSLCQDFKEYVCRRHSRAPHVCNGCERKPYCNADRFYYNALEAHRAYRLSLSCSRQGVNLTADELTSLDLLITPGIMKGQSISHIYVNLKVKIPCSKRTLYRYCNDSLLSFRNIDLPRQVRYKKRRKQSMKASKEYVYRNGRAYSDFMDFTVQNQETPIVEMDVVEGTKGGKVLLTLLFRSMRLMLAFILEEKTQIAVSSVFDQLEESLGYDLFCKIFPLILTDNGSEFQNPSSLETNDQGLPRTRIFYCDPYASYQKGALEKNHEFIRYIIPKGKSFDRFDQNHIALMINHINSLSRDSLNGKSPIDLAALLLPEEVLENLSLRRIDPDEILLKPSLLSTKRT